MKQYIFLIGATLTITTLMATPKPIITWDLHDVLLQKSGAWSAVSGTEIKDALFNLNWPLIKSLCSLLWNSLWKEATSEEFILTARHYNNPALAQIVINVANAQKVTPGMLDIVKKLNELGYTQQIASNIGLSSFEALITSTDPQIKELFSYLVTDINRSHVVTVTKDGFIKKPNKMFFQHYLDKNPSLPIIFIDDKEENIATAQEMGIDTITFTNPASLIEKLQKHGIDLSTNGYTFEQTTMLSTTTVN